LGRQGSSGDPRKLLNLIVSEPYEPFEFQSEFSKRRVFYGGTVRYSEITQSPRGHQETLATIEVVQKEMKPWFAIEQSTFYLLRKYPGIAARVLMIGPGGLGAWIIPIMAHSPLLRL
jgi:hypothetical protein